MEESPSSTCSMCCSAMWSNLAVYILCGLRLSRLFGDFLEHTVVAPYWVRDYGISELPWWERCGTTQSNKTEDCLTSF